MSGHPDLVCIHMKLAYIVSFSFQMVTRTKKIFVGGLSAPTTLEDVKSYFEQFGPVSSAPACYFNVRPGKIGNSSRVRGKPAGARNWVLYYK